MQRAVDGYTLETCCTEGAKAVGDELLKLSAAESSNL